MSRDTGIRPPRNSQEIRSQIAFVLLLYGYALIGSLVVIRSLLLALGVEEHLWVGRAVYGATGFFALPIRLLPGHSLELIGLFTVADLTLLAAVILFPVLLLMTGGRWGDYSER